MRALGYVYALYFSNGLIYLCGSIFLFDYSIHQNDENPSTMVYCLLRNRMSESGYLFRSTVSDGMKRENSHGRPVTVT